MAISPTKQVYIEIIGGDADGRILDSCSPDPTERELVEALLCETRNGEVGRGFQGLSLTQLSEALIAMDTDVRLTPDFMHQYFVAERFETDTELLIRMKYKGRKLDFHKVEQNDKIETEIYEPLRRGETAEVDKGTLDNCYTLFQDLG